MSTQFSIHNIVGGAGGETGRFQNVGGKGVCDVLTLQMSRGSKSSPRGVQRSLPPAS